MAWYIGFYPFITGTSQEQTIKKCVTTFSLLVPIKITPVLVAKLCLKKNINPNRKFINVHFCLNRDLMVYFYFNVSLISDIDCILLSSIFIL